MKKCNVGLMGSPKSESHEVFEALLRLDQTPKPDYSHVVDGLTEWEAPPARPQQYDAKNRKKFLSE